MSGALMIGVATLAVVGLEQRDGRERAERPSAAAPSASLPAAGGPEPAIAPPPASLRESDVDGELRLDADGHFAPTREALALFDYFLSASGEEPLVGLRARIEAEVARRLPPDAAREALAFLERYLAYRAAAARVAGDERIAASADLERRLQWLRELRREHFGAELAASLFGDEERAAEAALERKRVMEDASLSEEEKRARLAAIEQELPAAARREREAATLPMRLAEEERVLREAGGGDGELRALRERMVGPEAAERLAALDASRAEWERRLADYRISRDALLADAYPSPEQREARLESLRAQLFDARERMRVRTIDEIELAAPPGAPLEPPAR